MFPAMMDISSQLILRWERFPGEEIDVCDNFTRLRPPTPSKKSVFGKKMEMKIHAWEDSPKSALSETLWLSIKYPFLAKIYNDFH